MIVRAWPGNPPPGRPHVIDGTRRVPVDNYDYRGLAGLGDVVSMDWDTACSREDLAVFCAEAAAEPGRVLVAPMRMYGREMGSWNLARFDESGRDRVLTDSDVAAGLPPHVYGFGMVYLPGAMITGFLADLPGMRMTDIEFSVWHHERSGRAPARYSAARPVHLHYPEAQTGAVPV